MINIEINPLNTKSTSVKLGFNHTCGSELYPKLNELRPKVIRTYFNSEDIKKSYDVGAEPFVGVRFMPKVLSISGNRESPPKDFQLWREYVADTTSDILNAGMRPKYYSVWNEPERREEPIFWEGTLEDYVTLFNFTSRALKKVDPDCLVGGPETTAYEPKWTEKLLLSSLKDGFDVDFLSFHQFENPSKIKDSASLARGQYSRLKRKIPEIHIGEWGFNVKNAFFAQQHLASAEEAGIGFYCKDFFFERTWKCSVIDDNHEKRDMFYLLKEYSRFGDQRIIAISSDDSVKAIVTPTLKGFEMLVGINGNKHERKNCRLRIDGNGLLSILSIEEINSNGLTPINEGVELTYFELECQKVYLIKGRYA